MPFHKKFFGAVSKVAGLAGDILPVPGLGIVSRVAGGLAGRPTARPTVPRTQTARITPFSQREKDVGRQVKFPARTTLAPRPRTTLAPRRFGPGGNGEFFGGDPECPIPGMRVDPGTGECAFFFGERKGPDGGFALGEPVLGLYGAGIVPGSMVIDRAICGKGMQLGNDGVCYNKSQISNKQRMWPAGRKPLLTGGDMRAISTAARAGKRMDLATSRLQKLGMMKKPASRRVTTRADIRHFEQAAAHAAQSRH